MNLIICITPLQVLIAKQIIKKHSTPFIGLYLPYGAHSKSEPKHRYYFDQFEQVCEKSAFIELNNKTWGERFATLKHIKTTLNTPVSLNPNLRCNASDTVLYASTCAVILSMSVVLKICAIAKTPNVKPSPCPFALLGDK